MIVSKQGFKTLAAALLLGLASTVQADYVAYSVDKDGNKYPLPETIDNVEVEYLINIQWGDYDGRKSRIGVLPVENTSKANTVSISGPGGTMTWSRSSGSGVPVQGIEAILTDVMHRTNRFRMVERKVLDKALQEQDLGASGRMAKPSAAKIGKVLGAQYLFQAVVTNYEAGVEEKGGGLGGLVGGTAGAILGGLSMKSSKAVLGMNFRLIDAETSEIVYTDQVEVEIKKSGFSFGGLGFGSGGALGGFMSSYAKTPIGQAVISAVNRGVIGLVKQVGNSPATGSVIKVKGNKVYLNIGKDAVDKGEKLDLMRMGEELIDPDTGISLGGEEELVGTVSITSAKEKYSVAKPNNFKASAIKRGDKVVSQKKPAPLKFASSWNPPQDEGFFGSLGGSGDTQETGGSSGVDVLGE